MTEQELKDLIKTRVNDLLNKRNTTMRSLSKNLGFSEGYINQIMNNNMMPSLQAILVLADAMDMTLSEFFDNSVRYPIEYYRVNKEVQKLSARRLEALNILLHEEGEYTKTRRKR
ncbi:MAG: helix-turn-helix transcriptional regulator [Lachnospiraceae bacterium]|nr:helix-turn-helix transcriptional regulator [Lachnospiraceae bacterium]MBR1568647.1 helix-turn-helix transcriptional regulator [Lachnospiraceae bacterium]